MEFQVRFYLRTPGTTRQVLQSSQTGARVRGDWEEQQLLMSLIRSLLYLPKDITFVFFIFFTSGPDLPK